MKEKWTGERLETFIHSRDTIDHLHRYAIASQYVQGKVVLDIASGEGYGSNLMSESAKFVFGVDIDRETIIKAQKKYQKDNLQFQVGQADLIPISDNSIDIVVSFETLEHHDKHEEMMLEIKRVLKPNGILIISTPDKYFYSDRRNFLNEYHVKELYKNEFLQLMSSHFKNVQLLTQAFVNGNSFIYNDNIFKQVKIHTGNYSVITEEEIVPMYLVAILSDIAIQQEVCSFFDGNLIEKYNEQIKLEQLECDIRNSHSFRVGSLILFPFKIVKKAIEKIIIMFSMIY